MKPESRREQDRERWKLAKRKQRGRMKKQPTPISAEFRDAVLEERDRRERSAYRARRRVNGIFVDVAYHMGSFVADVWTAHILLTAEWGEGVATPTKIAKWLWDEGRSGDYAESSLRPTVYRALKIIDELETFGKDVGDPPFWGPFEIDLALLGCPPHRAKLVND